MVKGFKITCELCGLEMRITSENVRNFVNEMAWATSYKDFHVTEESPIAAFVSYDTTNETVKCKCGNYIS